jgi:hypothetical protein
MLGSCDLRESKKQISKNKLQINFKLKIKNANSKVFDFYFFDLFGSWFL